MSETSRYDGGDRTLAPSREATARADALMEVLDEFFREACNGDERLSRRLTVGDTVWTTHLTDVDRSFTIYLDRFPIQFSHEADPAAEVTVSGTVDDNIGAWTGQTFLGLLIAQGAMQYEGPVRKVLRVVPMFRPLGQYGDFRRLLKMSSSANGRGDSESPAA